MAFPSFNEFTKQASFFLKEKIKTVRLALTDVTATQLLTEEATNGDSSAPDACTLGLISRAAFEVDDYWRIVDILHNRLSFFDRRNWRPSYKALIVLEHLLTHGPKRVAEEFQREIESIREMISFQHVDERGFNWGLSVGKKSESVLKMLEDVIFLKEERARARKLTCGIKGFGSSNGRPSSVNGNLKDFAKCNSLFITSENKDNKVLSLKDAVPDHIKPLHEIYGFQKTATSLKAKSRIGEEFRLEMDHPFCEDEQLSGASLLSSIK